MIHQRAYNFLGLAQRAGQVQSGEAAVSVAMKKGKARLVILADDASENTKKVFSSLAKYNHVPLIQAGNKKQLGVALGKSARSVIAVNDENFASKLLQLFNGEEDF